MNTNIKVSNQWFRNEHLMMLGGHYAFVIYVILQKMQQMDGKIITSIGELLEYMCADRKSETNVGHIKGAIAFLEQEKLITMYEEIHMRKAKVCDLKSSKTSELLYLRLGELPRSNYTQIRLDELNIILGQVNLTHKNRVKILCYFATIVSHIDNVTKVAFPSFDTLQDEAKIGRREKCKQFNEELKDMGLLIYGNANVANIDNTGCVANTYARSEHEAELKAELNRLRETQNWKRKEIVKYQNADMKRSLKQRINKLQKKAEQEKLTMKEQRKLDRLYEQYNELSDGKEVL